MSEKYMVLTPADRATRNAQRRAHTRSVRRDHEIRTPHRGDNPVSQAAFEAGGVALLVHLTQPRGENGGCGTKTHVAGTNGGTMPCGSLLTVFGRTEPYYCVHCIPDKNSA